VRAKRDTRIGPAFVVVVNANQVAQLEGGRGTIELPNALSAHANVSRVAAATLILGHTQERLIDEILLRLCKVGLIGQL